MFVLFCAHFLWNALSIYLGFICHIQSFDIHWFTREITVPKLSNEIRNMILWSSSLKTCQGDLHGLWMLHELHLSPYKQIPYNRKYDWPATALTSTSDNSPSPTGSGIPGVFCRDPFKTAAETTRRTLGTLVVRNVPPSLWTLVSVY